MPSDPVYIAHCFNIATALLALVAAVRFLLVPHLRDEADAARRAVRTPSHATGDPSIDELRNEFRAAVCDIQVDAQDPEVVTVTLRANKKNLGYLLNQKGGENASPAAFGSIVEAFPVERKNTSLKTATGAPAPHDTLQ